MTMTPADLADLAYAEIAKRPDFDTLEGYGHMDSHSRQVTLEDVADGWTYLEDHLPEDFSVSKGFDLITATIKILDARIAANYQGATL